MPGFIVHTTANTLVLVGTTVVMRAQGWSWQDVIAVDAGIAVASLVLSPDMDLFNSKSMDDWGLLRWFWWPYAKLAKHRDRLHFPILGTAVRWLYVTVVLFLFLALFRFLFRRIGLGVSFNFAGDAEDILYNALYLADVFLGAVLADTMHYVLDMTTTRIKRLVPHHYHERYDRYVQDHHANHHRPMPGREWISEGEHQ